jgi:hypothetical protein
MSHIQPSMEINKTTRTVTIVMPLGEATPITIHRKDTSDRNHGRIENQRRILRSAASLLHRQRVLLSDEPNEKGRKRCFCSRGSGTAFDHEESGSAA